MNNITKANSEFPKSVIEQALAAKRIKPASFLSRRLDLRGKTIISFTERADLVAECAYSLYRVGDGWQLGIHVADVCEYVCEGSPLDKEARIRRTTFLVGSEYDRRMLPDEITQLCNLNRGEDRLAVSIILDIDSQGRVTNGTCEKSVIRVACNCIYSEIDQIQTVGDTSAIMLLREKYSPFRNIIDNMYELAAQFCMSRVERGGLDCTYFRRIYERDENGALVFRRESEPDSRAMLREIGYFTASAVGRFLRARKFPCVFNGRGAVNKPTLDYLSNLVNADKTITDPAKRTANIADLAKGTPYYGFVCDSLAENVPPAEFSVEPIPNSFCGEDTLVSFFSPISRYTDLLIQRFICGLIDAKDPSNLNLNRQRKILADVAAEANQAENFINALRKEHLKDNAKAYINASESKVFTGFPVYTNGDGSVLVVLDCGINAIIPAEKAIGYTYAPAQPRKFMVDVTEDAVFAEPITE